MSSHWPLFDLRIRTEHLELRLPTDADLEEMADLAARGVHDPSWMPFLFPWTRAESPALERGLLQYHWRKRAEWSPDAWALELGVFRDGEVVGCQEIGATEFAITRCVTTGSWLGRAHQGSGFGTEMRTAVLALAFDHLGAERAESGWLDGNEGSLGVSRSIGYRDDGTRIHVVEGRRRTEQLVSIDLEAWRSRARRPVEVDGLDACRELFGI